MNETFAKILQFTIIFWILLSLASTLLASRMQTYILNDDAINDIEDKVKYENINILSGVSILFDIMTFELIESVPIFITYILDLIFILTGLSLIMAITDR